MADETSQRETSPPVADGPLPWWRAAGTPYGVMPWCALAVVLFGVSSLIADPDFWWQLQNGLTLLSTHHLITLNPYTYTVTSHHWTLQEWLSELGLGAFDRWFGAGSIVILFSLVTFVGFIAIFLRSSWRSPSPGALGFGLVWGLLTGIQVWGPRIQMSTFCLAAVTILVIDYARKGHPKALWWCVPITALWANVEAGFIMAPILLGTLVISRIGNQLLGKTDDLSPTLKQSALALGGSMVAVCLNPYGPALWLYPIQTQFSPAQQSMIVEWFSPNFQMWPGLFLATLLISLIALIVINRKLTLFDALITLGLVLMTLQSLRQISLLIVIVIPIYVEQLTLGQGRWKRHRLAHGHMSSSPLPPATGQIIINWVVVVAILCAGVVRMGELASVSTNSLFYAENFPLCAANWLDTLPGPLRIFNEYNEAGYLIYRLHGTGDKVFIFGDAALMGDAMLYLYGDIHNVDPNWNALVSQAGSQIMVLDQASPLSHVVEESSAWTEVYADPLSIVFVKSSDTTLLATARAHPVVTSNVCRELTVSNATPSDN